MDIPRLMKEIRISWLDATKSMSVCNIITIIININVVFFFFFMTIIVPKQCRFLQQTSNRDTRDSTSAIQAFFPKPGEVSRKGLPRPWCACDIGIQCFKQEFIWTTQSWESASIQTNTTVEIFMTLAFNFLWRNLNFVEIPAFSIFSKLAALRWLRW